MRLSLIRLLPRVRTHHQIHDDTHAAIACDMLNPAQCPEHALMARIPLGLGPSLHQLRSRSALPCSPASQLLWPRPTSHARASSATAPRLPDADRRTRERNSLNRRPKPNAGYPRFRRDLFPRVDVLLEPRRERQDATRTMTGIATCWTHSTITQKVSAPANSSFPWLNQHTPTATAEKMYASCSALPPPHATLASRRLG